MKTTLTKKILTVLLMSGVCGCLLAQQPFSNYPPKKNNQTNPELNQTKPVEESKPSQVVSTQPEVVKTNSDSSSKEVVKAEIVTVSKEVKANELPGFPTYIDTGNPELDGKKYADAKQAWILNNQDVYKEYMNKNTQTKETATSNSNQSNINSTKVNADGFPVYQNTGNEAMDKSNYENAKKEWIKNNPEKYSQITNGSKTGPIVITRAAFQSATAEKQQYIIANPELYKIID